MASRQLNLAQSSNVQSASYDSDTQQLAVQFYSASGFYSGVPAEEADSFERADSPGRYVHEFLKTRFPWTRIA